MGYNYVNVLENKGTQYAYTDSEICNDHDNGLTIYLHIPTSSKYSTCLNELDVP